MKAQGRVLVVDDRQSWRDILQQTLTDEGYHVAVAASIQAAREALDANLFHMIILDIRMEEGDVENQEGMAFLGELHEKKWTEATKVVMLSAYGNEEIVRRAWREQGAFDFLTKKHFDNREFAGDIRNMFCKMKLNLDMDIYWDADPEDAVANLEIGGRRLKKGMPLTERIKQELEDLMRRLFYDATSIVVHPMPKGFSGAGILRVQPTFSRGGGQPQIVKFGDPEGIYQERDKFQEYVKPYLGGGRATHVERAGRTHYLGGVCYSLLGQDDFHGFAELYLGEPDNTPIFQILENLFNDTCAQWYGNKTKVLPTNLCEDYRQLLGFGDRLEVGWRKLGKRVAGNDKIRFTAVTQDHSLPNPVKAVEKNFFCHTYRCINHGDLNVTNLMVDKHAQPWLIDFQATGEHHILTDIAQLDASIRITLLAADDASPQDRFRMEAILASVDSYADLDTIDDSVFASNKKLARAFATSVYLRKLAGRLVSGNPNAEISEYFVPSLFFTVNIIRFQWLPLEQREHAFMAAAHSAARLNL